MLPTAKRILFSTDLSYNADYALRWALTLAKKNDAEIHILHVVEKISRDTRIALSSYLISADERKRLVEDRHQQARNQLEADIKNFWSQLDEQEKALKARVASVTVVESYPAEEILKSAENKQCDLIVMGAHDRGTVHTFLGSVTKSVLRRSNIPTLVVPLPSGYEVEQD